jgi:Saxitoxin biosynthesis operon protein SxtJ
VYLAIMIGCIWCELRSESNMATILEPKLSQGPTPKSSDRSFGLVFATATAIIGLSPLLHLSSPRWWALGVAVIFALLATLRPAVLHPLNVAWLALGRLMHRVMSPLVMGAVFFLCVTPVAAIMRLWKKDILSLVYRPDLSSYWIERESPPPIEVTFRRQY